GVNEGAGEDIELGCASARLPTGPPVGVLDVARWNAGNLYAAGWAFDPDTTAPVRVEVLVDGAVKTAVTANGHRPDVGAVHPLYGDHHGFNASVDVALAPGAHQICARAVDTTTAHRVGIGCRTVTVPGA